jgi:hypothetical protein
MPLAQLADLVAALRKLVGDARAEITFRELVRRRAQFQQWCSEITRQPKAKDSTDNQDHQQAQQQGLQSLLKRRTGNMGDVDVALAFRADNRTRDERVAAGEVEFNLAALRDSGEQFGCALRRVSSREFVAVLIKERGTDAGRLFSRVKRGSQSRFA